MTSRTYWFCYVVDLGVQFGDFPAFHTRDTLPFSTKVLRHSEAVLDECRLFTCQAGLLVVLQPVDAKNDVEHYGVYQDAEKYKDYERKAHKVIERIAGHIDESIFVVFPVSIAATTTTVDWKFVKLGAGGNEINLFIEALAVDHLCRVIDKMSDGLIYDRTLIQQKRLIEYVEGLRVLARPTSFLVNSDEIETMSKFYKSWKLEDRVEKARQSFADSIASANLYTGQIERNGQSAMNFLLAGIAVLSLTQVSKQITDAVSRSIGFLVTEDLFNSWIAVAGIVLIAWGVVRYLTLPWAAVAIGSFRDHVTASRRLKRINEISKKP